MSDTSISVAAKGAVPILPRAEFGLPPPGGGRVSPGAATASSAADSGNRTAGVAGGQAMGRVVAPASEKAESGANGKPDALLAANKDISPEEMEEVVASINDFLQSSKRALEFSVDETSGRTVIKVMDLESDKVIRQIPPEATLELISQFRDGNGVTATGLFEKA